MRCVQSYLQFLKKQVSSFVTGDETQKIYPIAYQLKMKARSHLFRIPTLLNDTDPR